MVRTDCSKVEELLVDYLYHELPPEISADVEAHLATCERCRTELAGFQAVRSAAQEIPRHAPPQGLAAAILAEASRSRHAAAPHGPFLEAVRHALFGGRLQYVLATAASVALVLFVGYAVKQGKVRTVFPSSERPVAADEETRAVPPSANVHEDTAEPSAQRPTASPALGPKPRDGVSANAPQDRWSEPPRGAKEFTESAANEMARSGAGGQALRDQGAQLEAPRVRAGGEALRGQRSQGEAPPVGAGGEALRGQRSQGEAPPAKREASALGGVAQGKGAEAARPWAAEERARTVREYEVELDSASVTRAPTPRAPPAKAGPGIPAPAAAAQARAPSPEPHEGPWAAPVAPAPQRHSQVHVVRAKSERRAPRGSPARAEATAEAERKVARKGESLAGSKAAATAAERATAPAPGSADESEALGAGDCGQARSGTLCKPSQEAYFAVPPPPPGKREAESAYKEALKEPCERRVKLLQRFVEQFPKDPRVKDARAHIAACKAPVRGEPVGGTTASTVKAKAQKPKAAPATQRPAPGRSESKDAGAAGGR